MKCAEVHTVWTTPRAAIVSQVEMDEDSLVTRPPPPRVDAAAGPAHAVHAQRAAADDHVHAAHGGRALRPAERLPA